MVLHTISWYYVCIMVRGDWGHALRASAIVFVLVYVIVFAFLCMFVFVHICTCISVVPMHNGAWWLGTCISGECNYICTCVCTCICICISMYVCICISVVHVHNGEL